ncbi:hypothetical protein HMPREF9554_02945 [Treponema phagedenis F0421]|nr:hypothetical protein HMPREF9554_02945 [Treponema phagedenis F0421]
MPWTAKMKPLCQIFFIKFCMFCIRGIKHYLSYQKNTAVEPCIPDNAQIKKREDAASLFL